LEQLDEIVRTDDTFNRWPLALDEEVYEDEICPLISTWWFACSRSSAACPSRMYVPPVTPAVRDVSRLVALAAPVVAPVNMNRLAVDDPDDDRLEVLGLAPGLALPVGRLVG
jgi:hypothetical protein